MFLCNVLFLPCILLTKKEITWMDEVLLIQECLKGKRKAQGELYRRYAAKMMGVCMRYSRNRDMAHDLLQEGFIKVFTNLNEYSGNGSFEGWMRKIFINCALEKIQSFPSDLPHWGDRTGNFFSQCFRRNIGPGNAGFNSSFTSGISNDFQPVCDRRILAQGNRSYAPNHRRYFPITICQGTLYFTTNDKKFILTMDRRDRFEELFRERLHNWECEPDSEQWKTLAGFLPLRPTRFSTRSIW